MKKLSKWAVLASVAIILLVLGFVTPVGATTAGEVAPRLISMGSFWVFYFLGLGYYAITSL